MLLAKLKDLDIRYSLNLLSSLYPSTYVIPLLPQAFHALNNISIPTWIHGQDQMRTTIYFYTA